MEKFLLILRESGINRSEQSPDDGHAVSSELMEWIHSLTKSGIYSHGVPIGLSGEYVARDEKSKGKSFGNAKDKILRFDIITAENIDQAVSVALLCPLVVQGLAVIEVRKILVLIR